MPPRAVLPVVLAVVGLLKAGAVLWAGARLGLPQVPVWIAASLWAVGPALAGWVWARRKARRLATVAVPPDQSGLPMSPPGRMS